MFSLADRQVFGLAVLFYGLSSLYAVFLWRKGFREDNRVTYVLLLIAGVLHTIAMFKRGFRLDACPVNNLYEAITFLAWTIVATYLVVGLWRRLRFLGAFASPILFAVGVFALMPALDPPRGPQPEFGNAYASVHAALILLSYGAFGLGAVAGLMYLTHEHNLKFNKLQAVMSLMPPIQRLETVIRSCLITGFVLLTVGLAMAPSLLYAQHGVYFKADPKILWSIFVWVLYGMLILLRRKLAPGGRRYAWSAVGGFLFVLLTFWGFNLLSTVHNPVP